MRKVCDVKNEDSILNNADRELEIRKAKSCVNMKRSRAGGKGWREMLVVMRGEHVRRGCDRSKSL